MLTNEQIKSLPNHLQWVKDLQVGERLEVKDNSYCFEITNNKRRMASLRTDIHDIGETGRELVVENIYLKGWQGYFSKKVSVYPTVVLKSNLTGKKYEVGICWGENQYC